MLSPLFMTNDRMWVIPICCTDAIQTTKGKVHLSILQSALDPLLLIKTEPGALKQQGPLKGQEPWHHFPIPVTPMLILSLVSTYPGALMSNSGCPSASNRVLSLHSHAQYQLLC